MLKNPAVGMKAVVSMGDGGKFVSCEIVLVNKKGNRWLVNFDGEPISNDEWCQADHLGNPSSVELEVVASS